MIKYLTLFYMFFKIGLFSFGGGYVMLPLIFQEIQTLKIMSSHEFSNLVALSQMTPGPIAVNAATYVGVKYAGFWGAVFASIGVALPSFIIVLIIAAFMNKFKSSKVIQAIMAGIRPATVGLMFSAVIFLSKTSIVNENFFTSAMLKNPIHYISIPSIFIFLGTIVLASKFKMGPIILTVLAGIAGAFIM